MTDLIENLTSNRLLPLLLSLGAFALSIMVAIVGYSQLKIASSKIKLDLYNKRFHIYETVLDLYQEVYFWEEIKIRRLELELIKSLRESKYLFDKEDKIYETILAIKDANAKNTGFHQQKKELPHEGNEEVLLLLHKSAVDGRHEFEKHLMTLEGKLEKYLSFNTINGWSLK